MCFIVDLKKTSKIIEVSNFQYLKKYLDIINILYKYYVKLKKSNKLIHNIFYTSKYIKIIKLYIFKYIYLKNL